MSVTAEYIRQDLSETLRQLGPLKRAARLLGLPYWQARKYRYGEVKIPPAHDYLRIKLEALRHVGDADAALGIVNANNRKAAELDRRATDRRRKKSGVAIRPADGSRTVETP